MLLSSLTLHCTPNILALSTEHGIRRHYFKRYSDRTRIVARISAGI